MFWFEKSLMGVYCNTLYDLGGRHRSFSCCGRIEANSTGKNVDVTNINVKASPLNRQIGIPLNSPFL